MKHARLFHIRIYTLISHFKGERNLIFPYHSDQNIHHSQSHPKIYQVIYYHHYALAQASAFPDFFRCAIRKIIGVKKWKWTLFGALSVHNKLLYSLYIFLFISLLRY